MKRFLLFLILILFLVLTPTGVILAQSEGLTVAAGETADEVVLFEGNLTVEAGGTVKGDVTLFSGDAHIAGTVKGAVVLFDGDLVAEETAVISGDCVIMSGNITDQTTTGLNCTNFENFAPALSGVLNNIPALPPVPAIPPIPPIPAAPTPPLAIETHQETSFIGNVVGAVFRSLLFGVLAFVAATLFPRHLTRVEQTAREKPFASGTVGFLTSLAVPILLLLLSPILFVLAFICGLGVLLAVAVVLGYVTALAVGWFAVGHLLGQRMAEWLNMKNRSLPWVTAVGTATLTLVLGLLGAVPFVIGEGLAGFLIACLGLGAVALTKFGTRPYPLLDEGIRILSAENSDKVTAVLNTLPEDDVRLK
ncbi:MAG: hypothetical protein KJ069_25790 [Anaerolineae bacterium]|nr:hypothetical protein [Anaerolineae bacterium]